MAQAFIFIHFYPCRMPQENWSLFLAQLRQLNDWLAHRDAAFQQIKNPIGGDSASVRQRMDAFTVSLIANENIKLLL